MLKGCLLFILSISVLPQLAMARIWPEEGGKLNYRLIGFSFPAGENSAYKLEIAAGSYSSEDSFKKNLILTTTTENGRAIARVPAFGAGYTWRIVSSGKNTLEQSRMFHHFSTISIPRVDTNLNRFRVLKPAETYKDALVFLDANKALYDMTGQPVWYLPNIDSFVPEEADVRDLKITPQGTITFLVNDKRAYEIDYNGNVLWSGPDNRLDNHYTHYHHELMKMNNGHYMILSTEPVLVRQKRGAPKDSITIIPVDSTKRENDAYFFPFGMLEEYDHDGKVVWSWKTSKYFNGEVPPYYMPDRGKNKFDVHVNAFFFDEKTNDVYLGFRNISWIVKAHYPSGDLLNIYGEIEKKGVPQKGNDLFCGQHSIRRSQDGYLYLYNNNACSKTLPTVVMFEEPKNKKGKLKKIWEYQCTTDGYNEQMIYGPTIGGNAIELPDKSFFVSMSSPYNKVFIVDRGKKILWSAVAEKYYKPEKKWLPTSQYRASIVKDSKELEQLVLFGEK